MANIFNVTIRQGNITLLAHRETGAQHHNHSGGEWGRLRNQVRLFEPQRASL